MREAMGRIARSPKKLNSANGVEALPLLLGLKPFSGERERPIGDGLLIAEPGCGEFTKGHIASRRRAVYGFNHQQGQKMSL